MENLVPAVQGFMYPNEMELQWSVLIVLYPFVTGLVAGAFILASLERVFNVEAVKPTYRLALLTALAFLLVAPLPLQLHLGHPERSLEMYLTPHTESAMAMFGFEYLWYLMVVLVLEIWLDYRKEIVHTWRESSGPKRRLYGAMALWSDNIGPEAVTRTNRFVPRFLSSSAVLGACSRVLCDLVSRKRRSRGTPRRTRPSAITSDSATAYRATGRRAVGTARLTAYPTVTQIAVPTSTYQVQASGV
jgi:hypothetical protein